MLISIWWVAVAFILGGSGGFLALAVLSAMPRREEFEPARIRILNPTR